MFSVFYRPRRLRVNQLVRDMAAETQLKLSGMIQPYFVCEGKDVKFEIPSMPGIFRESPDSLVNSITADFRLGIKRVMLFGVPDTKDVAASSAMGENAVVNHAIKMLKDKFGEELFISADVCLCAYTESGHCGVLEGNVIDNDKTLQLLAQMAVDLARAGCDCVAPSDMMDGRIGAIRDGLEDEGFVNTLILAYSAKYASAYYGPFREAAESAPQKGDRQSYQMDVRNRLEAIKEVALDIEEGADMVMVKPALAYLDIISDVRAATELPVAAYNVSGEYSMVKLMVQAGYAEEKRLVLENLTAITRAGADIILTYHLRDILKHGWLNG
jgi:porphobilinogen synthase